MPSNGTAFPAYLRVEYDDRTGFREFEAAAGASINRTKQQFQAGFSDVQRIISDALSRPRGSTGALDIDTAGLRRAASDAQAYAIAAREVSQAAERAARSTQDTTEATRIYVQASRAAAIEAQRQAADLLAQANAHDRLQAELAQTASGTQAVVAAQNRGSREAQLNIASMGQQRQGLIQVGQQLQDITVGFASGQRAGTIFAQQLPQLALALQNMGLEAGGAGGRLAAFARFLSGPWGIALTVAIPLVALFGQSLFDTGEESDKLKDKSLSLQGALETVGIATENARKALEDYNRTQAESSESTALEKERLIALARARVQETIAIRDNIVARIEALQLADRELRRSGDRGAFGFGAGADGLTDDLTSARGAAETARQALNNLRIERAQIGADIATDPIARINDQYDRMADAAITAARGNDRLTASLEGTLAAINRQKNAALDAQRASTRESRRASRDPGELTGFLSPLAGRSVQGNYGQVRGDRRHAGVDLATPVGTPVQAAAAGTVITVGNDPGGYGNYVIVDHGGGTTTRYAHLLRATKTRGQAVAAGEQIALSGNTGRSTGPHLHYEVRRGGRAVDPRTGRFPTDSLDAGRDSQRIIERQAREAEQLQRAIDGAAEATSRLRGQFDAVPKDIDRATAAQIDLQQIIDASEARLRDRASLNAEQIAALEATIASARETKDTLIPEALRRPVRDQLADGERDIEIGRLRVQGREEEAAALEDQYRLMDLLGVESADLLATELQRRGLAADTLDQYIAQRQELERQNREAERLDRSGRSVRAQLEQVDGIRSSLERGLARLPSDAAGAVTGLLDDLQSQFRDLFARSTIDRLFGDTFAELENELRNDPRSRADRAVEESSQRAAAQLDALTQAARTFGEYVANGGNSDILVVGPSGGGKGVFAANDNSGDPADIFNRTFTRLFERYLGKGSPLARDFGSILSGYAQAGPLGAGINGLNALVGDGSPIGALLSSASKALPQIAIALEASQALSSLLGNDQVKNGKTLGVISPFLTAIFGSALRGSATIGGGSADNFAVSVRGNSGRYRSAAEEGAQSVIATVQQIAERLGGTVDASRGSVSIGIRKGDYRVDTTGRGVTRTSRGAIDFGDDAEAAARAAAIDLIQDGVIVGLREGTRRLIQATGDLDAQLQKALDFESVFTRLKEYKDPVGAALDTLDKEFTRLNRIFGEAGATAAEYAQLEELYGIERAKAVKEAGERVTASLRGLFDSLTVGNDARSLRERQGFARANYDPLAARVAAGDQSAYDDFAKAAQELLDIQRQISGSTTDYFSLLDQVTALTKTRIDAETNIASISSGRSSPFNSDGTPAGIVPDNGAVVSAIENQTNALLAGLQGFAADIIRAAIYSSQGGGAAREVGFRTAAAL